VSLAEIVERLDQISQVWRSDTSAEQRLDLADLDDLLEQLRPAPRHDSSCDRSWSPQQAKGSRQCLSAIPPEQRNHRQANGDDPERQA
jgi:hypothetical protein